MLWCAWLCVLASAALAGGNPAQVDTGSGSPTVASARDFVTQGKLDDASRALQVLAAERPEPAGVERLRGIVDYQRNRMADAEADFTRAVEEDPSDLQSMQ